MKPNYVIDRYPSALSVTVRRYKPNGKRYELNLKARFRIIDTNSSFTRIVEVPSKFETDFASVPQIFHSIIGPVGKWVIAALLHDYLYSKQFEGNISREQADAFFYKLMLQCHVQKPTAWIMWACVRMFGKSSWKK